MGENSMMRKVSGIMSLIVFLGACPVSLVSALDNGLARTPPMGWNSWNIFHENINENLIKQIADAIVESGMKDAGYIYLNLDDNWMASSRDANGKLRADPNRFPSGMKALGDYIHSKGLKFGIYGDRGLRTCHHYNWGIAGSQSGSYMKEELDARTFAEWGVDYLKYDNCEPAPGSDQQQDYERMRDALAKSGRDIVFSICAWGFASWMPKTGNLWRSTGDITDKWDNGNDWFRGIINAVDGNADLAQHAGPGGWNDPDMLEIGNGGCTTEEYRSQMSMWCIMASPLIAGHDVRKMSQATKDILLNREVIAINQDSAGIQGTRISRNDGLEVWCKPLGSRNGTTKAVALLNRNSNTRDITVRFADVGLSGEITVRDLWAKADRGSFTGSYTMSVPSHGTGLLKLSSGPAKPISAFSKIEAEHYSLQSGVQTETCSEGGENIGFIENGDYVAFNNVDFEEGADVFVARVASANDNGGTIEIRLDKPDGTLAGSCTVEGTGGWQTWTEVSCNLTEISGKHNLYLRFTGGESYLLNLNWFQFTVSTGERNLVRQLEINRFKAEMSNGNIAISPSASRVRFNASVYMPDGRLVTSRNNINGVVTFPVKSKGIYLVNIECNGQVEKKMLSYF